MVFSWGILPVSLHRFCSWIQLEILVVCPKSIVICPDLVLARVAWGFFQVLFIAFARGFGSGFSLPAPFAFLLGVGFPVSLGNAALVVRENSVFSSVHECAFFGARKISVFFLRLCYSPSASCLLSVLHLVIQSVQNQGFNFKSRDPFTLAFTSWMCIPDLMLFFHFCIFQVLFVRFVCGFFSYVPICLSFWI
jgi:hypothetical protein